MDSKKLELMTEVQKVRLEIARAWQLNEPEVGWRAVGSENLVLKSEALKVLQMALEVWWQ